MKHRVAEFCFYLPLMSASIFSPKVATGAWMETEGTAHEVLQASRNLPLHSCTPLVQSAELSQTNGCNVWLKLENQQPTSSFKIRGIGHMCQKKVLEENKTHLVSSSGGNAGYAVAYAGKKLNAKVTVVLPKTSKPHMKKLMEDEGAEVIIYGSVWDESNNHALEICSKDPNAAYIPPFDGPLLWQGHSTMVDEIIQQLTENSNSAEKVYPDAVVCTVGGGGLLNGVVQGLQSQSCAKIPVIAVETHGSNSFYKSAETLCDKKSEYLRHISEEQTSTIDGLEGISPELIKEWLEPVSLKSINSIATSLGAKKVSKQSLENFSKYPIIPMTVSDEMSAHACLKILEEKNIKVEPACGAGLSLAYHCQLPEAIFGDKPNKERNVVFIVCGGSCSTEEDFEKWKADPNVANPTKDINSGLKMYENFWGNDSEGK